MVDDPDAGLAVRVQHGDVELHERAVAPQRALVAGVQAEAVGHDPQLVVPVVVGQVAGAHLGTHVPAVEGGERIVDATDAQSHVRDHRYRVPAQVQPGKPEVPRMVQRYLQDGVFR